MREEKARWSRFLLVAAHAATGNRERLAAACADYLEAGGSRQDCFDLFAFMAPFCGFPRALAAHRASRLVGRSMASRTTPSRDEAHRTGKAMFQSVYGDLSDRILSRIEDRDPVLADILIEIPYGEFYPRPDWPLAEKELLACLFLETLGCGRELSGHILAAKRLGAEEEDLLMVQRAVEAARQPVESLREESCVSGRTSRSSPKPR